MPTQILRPNLHKIFLGNLFKVIVGLLLLVLVFFLAKLFGVFEFMDEIIISIQEGILLGESSQADSTINSSKIVLIGIFGFIGLYIILLFINYFMLSQIRYEFSEDKLTSYLNAFLITLDSKEIPYQNISRVSFNNDSLMNKLLGTGTVVLELSAMKLKELKIDGIDNPQQVAGYIMKVKRDYDSKTAALKTERYRLKDILSEGGL